MMNTYSAADISRTTAIQTSHNRMSAHLTCTSVMTTLSVTAIISTNTVQNQQQFYPRALLPVNNSANLPAHLIKPFTPLGWLPKQN